MDTYNLDETKRYLEGVEKAIEKGNFKAAKSLAGLVRDHASGLMTDIATAGKSKA